MAFVVAGIAVRVWAAGYIVGEQLATTGPYAHMRNPLYLGSLLITLGWCAMAARADVAAVLLGVFFATHCPTIAAEERYLRERYGAEYEAYCRRVPRWLPRPFVGGGGAFSWYKALYSNEERKHALAVVILAAA